jgi:regulation of enolase protein 1 (concanavalin A-like superfamily)
LINVWTFVNPVGDGSVSVTNNALRISVPGGVDHDAWTSGNRAPRVMQMVADGDFEVEAKFESAVTQAYQLQGLIVEQDANNYLRFDVYSYGSGVSVLAASFVNGSPTVLVNSGISAWTNYYLRVKREGSQWTYSYSYDGTSWATGATFTRSLAVSKAGVFAGNAGGAPAFTAVVDYVFNTASPIVPEDGAQGTVTVNVVGNGTVTKSPDQPSYEIGQVVELSAVPATGWNFTGWSGAVSTTNNPVFLTVDGNETVTATFTQSNPPPPAAALVSDDFNGGTLSNMWTFVNPVGDGSVSVSNNVLRISVPGGVDHDVWTGGNRAPRVMQTVKDADFEVEARFPSGPQSAYQLQGFIVEQDANNYLRFDVHSDGVKVKLFAASFESGASSVKVHQDIPMAGVYYLKVNRQGSAWTWSYSYDGVGWTTGVTFTRAMTVGKAGVFAGNTGSSPAFTAAVDYVFNTASPIVPEDGGQASITLLVQGLGTVTRNPDKVAYAVGETVEFMATPAENWGFAGWDGDLSGTNNPAYLTVSGDHAVTAGFVPLNSDALIKVWYGNQQVYGETGIPQSWVNIHGNVTIPEKIYSLSMSLNGVFQNYLTFGPGQNPRLARPGDFNAELAYGDLTPGSNAVTLTATLLDGKVYEKAITLDYVTNSAPPESVSIDWSSVSEIGDVAQIVDGNWAIAGGGVRILEPHYDRLIAIGDISWTDYEVTVPVTVHGTAAAPSGYVPAVGLVVRWQGHYDWDGSQPRVGWNPLGAIGWLTWDPQSGSTSLQLLEDNATSGVGRARPFAVGLTYMLKMRVETVAGQPAGLYHLKVWEQGQSEPVQWDLTHQAQSGLAAGSLLLLAHYADVTFGNVTVVPLASP